MSNLKQHLVDMWAIVSQNIIDEYCWSMEKVVTCSQESERTSPWT